MVLVSPIRSNSFLPFFPFPLVFTSASVITRAFNRFRLGREPNGRRMHSYGNPGQARQAKKKERSTRDPMALYCVNDYQYVSNSYVSNSNQAYPLIVRLTTSRVRGLSHAVSGPEDLRLSPWA